MQSLQTTVCLHQITMQRSAGVFLVFVVGLLCFGTFAAMCCLSYLF
jgi:hypothetical protein